MSATSELRDARAAGEQLEHVGQEHAAEGCRIECGLAMAGGASAARLVATDSAARGASIRVNDSLQE